MEGVASGVRKLVYFNMRVHQPYRCLSYFTLYKNVTLGGCIGYGLNGEYMKTAIISETSA
jgi:hypothetical protein